MHLENCDIPFYCLTIQDAKKAKATLQNFHQFPRQHCYTKSIELFIEGVSRRRLIWLLPPPSPVSKLDGPHTGREQKE
jgi:hypothetical protein